MRWKPAGQAGTKSLTSSYPANRTRVRVITVRRELVGSGMASLTCYQANRIIEVMLMRWKPSGHGAGTKSLTSSYPANRTRVGVMTVRRELVGPGMESLTYYQANRITEVMSVRWKPAGPGMEPLTYYQANRITEVMSVRWKPAGPGTKSLTFSYPANRTRVGVMTVCEKSQLDLAWNHSHPIKPTEPE